MDDLRAVMDAAGFERAAIFGISEGGPMSTLFAATYPDRVSSLVLYGTYARMMKAPDFSEGVRRERLDAWAETVRKEWGGAVTVDMWAPSSAGRRRVRTLVGSAAAPGHQPFRRDRADGPLPGDRRACRPPDDRRPHPRPAPRSRTASCRYARGATWRRTIPNARYVELQRRRPPGLRSATRTPSSTRSRSSSSAAATAMKPNGRWRRSSSPTSSARPRWPRGSVTAAGATCSSATTPTVREQLALHRGREVKTMGDGFLAVFDGPARAIRCAVAIRDELREDRHRGAGRHPYGRGRTDRRGRRRHGRQHRRPGRRPRRQAAKCWCRAPCGSSWSAPASSSRSGGLTS